MSKRSVALFVLFYLCTLIATAPASLLNTGLQYVSQGRLWMTHTSGTVWDGSAILALRTQEGHVIALPFLHWEIDVLSLVRAKIRARLQWDNQPATNATEAIISLNQLELHHAQFVLPARVLGEASSMLKPLQLRGQLQIQSENIIFSTRGMAGTAVVGWRQASSAISRIAPLGDYRLALEGKGDRIHIGLSTNSGILLLEGDGNWMAGRGLEFHGKAHASDGNYDTLTELLHHLGPEITPEIHAFNFKPQ